MAQQHLKDKLTGNPRLSPLQRSLQKTFSCFIYIYTAILTQHRNSSSTDSGSTTPWTHQLQGITRNQHLTAQQRVFLNLPTQGHVMNQRNQWGGGGERKKSLQTQSSVTSSQALTLSAPEASLPWQPWHLQPSCQESRERRHLSPVC